LPTRDIDGRGNTPKEAVEDMWKRLIPLEQDGYHAVSSVEIVDTKTNKVVESFQVTDPRWTYLRTPDAQSGKKKERPTEEHHRPPTAHEFAFKARVKLQQ